jgi:DNA uptake protein ComE-like DNA-binding protein
MAKLKVLPASPSVVAVGGLMVLVLAAVASVPQHAAVPTQASGAAEAAAVSQVTLAPTREATPRIVYPGPVVTSSEVAAKRLQARPADVPVVPILPTTSPAPISLDPQDAPPERAPARLMGAEVATPATAVPQAAPATSDKTSSATGEPARGVDLNSASVEELNALGGGRIGRAIVNGRPYRSPDELLHKRVLTRATFEQIKEQIIVQ